MATLNSQGQRKVFHPDWYQNVFTMRLGTLTKTCPSGSLTV